MPFRMRRHVGRGGVAIALACGSALALALVAAGPSLAAAPAGELSGKTGCGCAGSRTTEIAQPVTQINLNPPHGRGSAAGIAEVVRHGHGHAVAIVAQGVTAAGAHEGYAVWLWRSRGSAKLLVGVPGRTHGRMAASGPVLLIRPLSAGEHALTVWDYFGHGLVGIATTRITVQ